jgi:UDP-N-acetylmuramoyl-L-alanyl-D-glutamate--2,6-diaminopimelate ligase
MTTAEVLTSAGLQRSLPEGLAAAEVRGLAYDSRRVQPGNLYFAFQGAKVDGRNFAFQAMERGALAVVSEQSAPPAFSGPWVEVAHGRTALSTACRNFFGPPERRFALFGITGTNGKTTTSILLDSILHTAGHVTGLIGTIEYRLAGEVRPAVNTTPESLDLYLFLEELGARGGTHVTMEVSSHALALRRVFGIGFAVAIFTNLTRDHLDFHLTMEQYFTAKHLLFEGAGAAAPGASVVNFDDAWGRRIAPGKGSRLLSYGIDSADAAVRAVNIKSGFEGLHFEIATSEGAFAVASPLVGRINVYNILAAAAAGLAAGLTPETGARGVAACRAVSGRFERVDEGQPFLVVVDYAHTDDALRNTIQVARALGPQRIITLFGCGGDRDRSKRPLMGQAAAELSDFVVLTSDNPRSEDPLAIMNDAMVGLGRFDTPHIAEVDRGTAIRKAIEEAREGDIVILAGKGHEPYQELKSGRIAFDDREKARTVLRGFGYGGQRK